jgi:hypothetical protein
VCEQSEGKKEQNTVTKSNRKQNTFREQKEELGRDRKEKRFNKDQTARNEGGTEREMV